MKYYTSKKKVIKKNDKISEIDFYNQMIYK